MNAINFNTALTNTNVSATMKGFSQQALKEGWTQDEVNLVLKAATSGSIKNFFLIIESHCEPILENDKYDDWGNDDDDNDDSSDYQL